MYSMGMRISFSTATYYHLPLDYSLRLARDLGYDGVEWVVSPGYLLNGLQSVQAAFRATGARALSIHPPLYPFPGWPRRAAPIVARLGALSRRLGAELFVVHTPLLTSLQSPRALAYSEALSLGQLAGGPDVRVGIENSQYIKRRMRRRYLLDDLGTLARFCQERDCGITFDTCHAGANGENLLGAYAIVKPALRNIHLSDVIWRDGRPRTHRLPGEGELPLDAFLAALARDDYDGLVTIETHPLHSGPFNRARAERRLGQALEFVRKHTARPAAPTPGSASGGQRPATE
jgi:sugar phosphate isomerase/epimerase